MATDEEKCKVAKLLHDLEVPELKMLERCSGLVKEFEQKYGLEMESEVLVEEIYDNPYVVDKKLLDENERKLRELLAENKRAKKQLPENVFSGPDPKRPWRTQSCKEKLMRIDNDIKRLLEKSNQSIDPLKEEEMQDLLNECREETLRNPPVNPDRLRESVDEARKNLPNFQYRTIENSTATIILPNAHEINSEVLIKEFP
ncbi:uncharacterized protein LOC110995597 [Pieris rapae]|uniref:uncharacterized protein LOC110995597 n=1 Tax=Pieris rapae TaxID=64459 RepID=UPI000B925D44|nr:uncharacterized protein LOC110995597 [Pieris rapae]